MALMKNRKGSFFVKYFFIFAAIILASFFVIGVAMTAFVSYYLRSETLSSLSSNAERVSTMTADLLNSTTIKRNPEGAAMMLYKTIEITSECTNSDVFICNTEGKVIACKDIMSNSIEVSKNVTCPYHSKITLSADLLNRARNSGYTEYSKLGTIYDKTHAVALEPISADGVFYGVVVVTAPVSGQLLSYILRVLSMFLIAAAIALILIMIAVYFFTDHLTKPIRELAAATKCYARGDFSYKVPEMNSNDELAELITEFNAMAVSLSQLENSRRSFVANVSHEFKTPMTTIGGFINGILDGTIPPEKQSYYLQIVSSEISRLSKMVNMMLNISKIETGNVDLKIEQFSMREKLITTFLSFEQLISDKKIDIEGLEDLPEAKIRADAAMISQAVYNLVDNAVKFTESGGRISVKLTDEKTRISFSITNSGRGIPASDLNKVFDRFYKVDKSRSTDNKSTGLGLYLIRSIIELHGGTIGAQSRVGEFTTFTVHLPK